MNSPRFVPLILSGLLLGLAGCANAPKTDYTAFKAHRPRSILVLPPINHTVEVNAGYSVLTAASRPIAELGYYVFPVNVVDQFMKENGIGMADEMQQVPLEKLRQTFGCDAVLYLAVEKYGTKYQVLSSNIYVTVHGRLVDAATGTVLWDAQLAYVQQGQSGLLEAMVDQVMNKLMDSAHVAAQMADTQLFTVPGLGFLPGPRRPEAVE
jgi:hypothetical protein